MAAITVVDASGLNGGIISPSAATVGGGGDTLAGGDSVSLLVVNGAGANNVVLVTPETVEGSLTVQDRTIALAANEQRVIPVPARYNDSTTGLTTVTFSAAATRAAFRTQ